MAVIRACNGVVLYGGGVVGELRGYSLDEVAARLEASVMGTCTKRFSNDAVQVTGVIRCYFDPADTTQISMFTLAAAPAALVIRANGTGSGKPNITMSAVVFEGKHTAADVSDPGVTMDFDFFNNGTAVHSNQP